MFLVPSASPTLFTGEVSFLLPVCTVRSRYSVVEAGRGGGRVAKPVNPGQQTTTLSPNTYSYVDF